MIPLSASAVYPLEFMGGRDLVLNDKHFLIGLGKVVYPARRRYLHFHMLPNLALLETEIPQKETLYKMFDK